MSGAKIIRALEDAVAGNFSRVHIDGQTWARQDWQDISTAPHNTRVILAWRDWRDDAWLMEVGPATTGQRFNNGYSNLSQHGSATHWMPLPSPPREGGR